MKKAFHDAARYWRSPLLPDAELLTAEYYEQEFAPHWHEGYSIPVIHDGAQTYRYRGGLRLAGAGSIAAINPDEVHTGERATDHGWAYRAFYPSAAWMRQLASDIAGKPSDYPWLPDEPVRDPEVAGRLLHAHCLLECGTDMLATETELTGAFALLIARHARARPSFGALRADSGRVAAMQAKLAEDLALSLTLNQLAESVGLSPFHASRLFSASVGMPPHAWRNQLRLSRALGLLRQGKSVTEAAVETGFTDQSHFTRHFKRAYGVAPGRWKTA